MGIWDVLKGKGTAKPPQSAPARARAPITAYDERGRELQIQPEDWLRSVFLPALESDWNDADALYGRIIAGLRDDLSEHLLPAAAHLVELDGASERSLVVQAIVLMDVGDLGGAEQKLKTSCQKHGRSAVALTNLAKVFDKRGDAAKAHETLGEALALDPNFENAVLWWAAVAREQGGEQAYLAALGELAQSPKAWLPRLWIARQALKSGNVARAREQYQQVLAVAADERDVLMMVSGDLGNAGQLELLVELVAPHYDLQRHGPQAGINLAEALKELGRLEAATALVRQLLALEMTPLAERLSRLQTEIARKTPPQTMTEPPQVSVMSVDGPLWLRGLYDVGWVLPPVRDDSPELTFVALTSELSNSGVAEVQRSDDLGRLTRALPLYWNTRFRLGFEATTRSLMFVVNPGGPAILGAPQEPAAVVGLIPEASRPQIIVVGSVVEGGVRIEAWDRKAGQQIAEHRAIGALSDLGPLADELAQQLERTLLGRGLILRRARSERFSEPPAQLLNPYVLAHEQLFYQTLAANEITQASTFYNERSFFETTFGVFEAWPEPPDNAQMLAVCSVVMGVLYESSIVAPYRKLVLRWLDEAKAGSVLHAVAPAVLRRFGEQPLLDAWLRRNPDAPRSAEHAAWLARVREATS
jgi:tetratricopeptide (TPR) repeat protein